MEKYLKIFFVILSIQILTSCKSLKIPQSFDSVKSGYELDKINIITFKEFSNVWVNNRKRQKLDINTHKLYEDSVFTYFGKNKIGFFTLTPDFFKVYSDSLNTKFPNYVDFYGSELRNFLWTEVIPEGESKRWGESKCSYVKRKPILNYTFSDQQIFVSFYWEIKNCEELSHLKGKKYQASYNLITKKFQKTN